MFRLTIKELGARKLRLLATAMSVVLGVAFLAGTLVLTATIRSTFDSVFADGYAGTDAYVRGESAISSGFGDQTPRLDSSLVPTIAAVDGVAAAEGRVSGYAQLVAPDGEPIGDPGEGAPTMGETWMTVAALNPYRLADGRAPARSGEIVIDRQSARSGDLTVGDTVDVLTKAGRFPFTVSGIATFDDADSMAGASAVLFTAADAERYVAEPGQVDAIAVVGDDGISQLELAERVGTVLPSDTEVLTGAELIDENQESLADQMSFFNAFLMVFAVVALLVGSFIIANTFSIVVAQRQRELALLRAIGASARQVRRSVLMEAIVVGLVSSAAGVVAGIGVAQLLTLLLESMGLELPGGSMVVGSGTVVTSLAVGTGVTVLAAMLPARRAGKVAPVAAMQEVATGGRRVPRVRSAVGALLAAGGVAAVLAGLQAEQLGQVGLGALALTMGVVALTPALTGPVARVIGLPISMVSRLTGSLARRNAVRSPRRTASTATALMLGVTLVGFITVFAASAKASISHGLDRDVSADFALETGVFDGGGVSHELAEDVASRPEIASVVAARFARAEVDGEPTMLNAFTAEHLTTLFDIDPLEGSVAALGDDGIAVARDYADEHRLVLGSPVEVSVVQGTVTLTVQAIYDSAIWTGPVFVDLSVLDRVGVDPMDGSLYVATAEGFTDAQARAAIDDATAAYPNVTVLDRDGFKADRSAQIDTIVNLVYALLALAIVIALLGIANTLALSIFERTRELGLLRALGMTRSQVRATVRWESVVIALFGTTLGLGLGSFLGWAMVRALADQGFDTVVLPVLPLVAVAAIAAVAGVVAAIAPARRAARLDVLTALATV